MKNTAIEKPMERGLVAVILILPFILFYWMTPLWSNRNIGQDYVLYAPMYQMELMLSIKSGAFPLYAPGFFGGQSASALTMGEIHHPISHLSAIMPGYWDGYALKWNTLFRLVSLGWAHLALFCFLRKFPIRIWMAFLFSTITVYNLRALLLFNYGCALETWTGFLVLCAAIGLLAFHPGRVRYLLLIIGSGYWMITSGHPQMMYYGFLGALATAVLIPFFVRATVPSQGLELPRIAGLWLRIGVCMIAAVALAACYIFPFYVDFVATNAGRADQGYAWAVEYHDSLAGTLNNFFNPLRSGVSAFGGTPLFLCAAALPLMRLVGMRIPPAVWSAWGIALLLFLHVQGPRLPVHFLFWKYLPFASTFREPGRIAMLIPFFLMLILVWFTATIETGKTIRWGRTRLSAQIVPALAALLMTLVYLFLPQHLTAHPKAFCPANVLLIPARVEHLTMGLSCLILIAWIFAGLRDFPSGRIGLFISVLTIACLAVFLRYGIWIDKSLPTPPYEFMRQEKKRGLYYRPHPGEGYKHRVVVRQLQESFLEPHIGKIFYRFESVRDTDETYERMSHGRSMDLAFIEGLSHASMPDMTGPSMTYAERALEDRVDLVYSSFNRLVFNAISGEPSFFGFGYPFTGHWKAFVDDRPTPLYRANGAAHAVWIPAGRSRVEFRYQSPAAEWGMGISMAVFGFVGAMIGWRFRRALPGKTIAIASILLAVAGFLLWRHSLYAGENLDTRYQWRPAEENILSNLAYGKTATMSSHIHFHPYFYGANRGVDGDRHTPYGFVTRGSCFITDIEESPWWRVDLGRAQRVGEIDVYLSLTGEEWNRFPFTLAVSTDGTGWEWSEYHRLSSPGKLSVRFREPLSIRYVKIMASGYCRLALDEIEIYPPGDGES